MKKENFLSLILSAAGALLLGIGMCMALLPEWNVFRPGIGIGGAGLGILLVMALARRKMKGPHQAHRKGHRNRRPEHPWRSDVHDHGLGSDDPRHPCGRRWHYAPVLPDPCV